MNPIQTPHRHTFQAEVAQLLHLVTHSLYSHPDIFLRELISNASDACDKLRFEAIKKPEVYQNDTELKIEITFDKDAKTLSIRDNGIGLSEEEAIAHLGTIAKSGTREFMERLSGDAKADTQLIGQFGVGFYSAFIVADRVVVESRKAGAAEDQGVRWTSQGTGDFEVQTISRKDRGTTVILDLKEDALKYANGYELRELIRHYSDHIALPIRMYKEKWQDGEKEGEGGHMVTTDEWETVNQASALWTRPKSEITAEQYQDFYKQLSSDFKAPLAYTHNRVEGANEYTQLLYIPSEAPFDLWHRDKPTGVKLYVRRVFIMNDAQALLPNYLRFVRGVIDSENLPLNVSREILQESKDVRAIREGSTKRVLGLLEDLSQNQAEDYERFYEAFGALLKEGLAEDHKNADRLAKLLRFASTAVDKPTGLADYVSRMKEGQKAIYYLVASSLEAARHSPQLEQFKKKGIEVLLLGERIDEWMLNFLPEFEGHTLQSIAHENIDWGDLKDEAETKAEEETNAKAEPLVKRLHEALKDQVQSVRVSHRLTESPACLVLAQGTLSPAMEKILGQAGQSIPKNLPILEINPTHPMIEQLNTTAQFEDWALVLLDQAKLAQGLLPENPAAYVKRIQGLTRVS